MGESLAAFTKSAGGLVLADYLIFYDDQRGGVLEKLSRRFSGYEHRNMTGGKPVHFSEGSDKKIGCGERI